MTARTTAVGGQPDHEGPLRALHVLETLASMPQPASLPAIAERAQLPRSMAYRTLRSLQDRGFIEHAGHGGYRIGSRSVALASLIGPRPALLQRARPVLQRLAVLASGAALHLRSGSHRVLVLGVAANNGVPPEITVGERAPLTSGCSGTSILAHLTPAEIAEITAAGLPGEPRPSPAFLASIRADGYALSFSANHPGLNGIAAPVLDPTNNYPLGSIAIAGADARLQELALRRLSGPLRVACADLAPHLAKLLGPNSSASYAALDVTIQDFLDG